MLSQEQIKLKAKSALKDAIHIRREFHQFPELGFEEEKTTAKIIEYLTEAGIEPIRLNPTGVVAYLGPKDGKTLALRADIDGLAVTEQTGLSFSSKIKGHMHACGHDGHIAGLLTAAFLLKEMEKDLTVRVKLIFQPSEENAKGAKHILKQGVLDDVDCIFGLHLFSDMDKEVISIDPGPRMAQTDRFKVTFTGKGGHAGKPHQCVDATVMAADFVMSAQSIVSRKIDPVKGGVLTIGSLHSGTQYNIISEEAVLEGTCRSYYIEVAEVLRDSIIAMAHSIAKYYGGNAKVDYDYGAHPPVYNSEEFTQYIKDQAKGLVGADKIKKVPALMLGEDFSWYQSKVPGVFAFVGCKESSQKECFPNHHPCFDICDDALYHAVLLHLSAVGAAEEFLKKKIDI